MTATLPLITAALLITTIGTVHAAKKAKADYILIFAALAAIQGAAAARLLHIDPHTGTTATLSLLALATITTKYR